MSNVRNFGAIGDGKADDTRAIQHAVADGDGVLDLVFNGRWIRNTNPIGWPFEAADPIDLGAGDRTSTRLNSSH